MMRISSPTSSFPIAVPILGLALLWSIAPGRPLKAQSTAWQPLIVSDGVEITFVVHRYGDGKNAGVVIKLSNRNPVEASYRFRAVFKSGPRKWIAEPVEGVLKPLEMRTGELSGLWWIPFKDGAPVTEVGLKGLRISVSSPEEMQNGSDTTS